MSGTFSPSGVVELRIFAELVSVEQRFPVAFAGLAVLPEREPVFAAVVLVERGELLTAVAHVRLHSA